MIEPPVDAPEVRYVRSGELFIAYQVLGDGPLDLVFVAEFWHSIEAQWEHPAFAAFLRGLASFGRLICFDQRGTGISDPVALDQLPTVEDWMDDVRAVMEAVGSRRAVLITSGGGSSMAVHLLRGSLRCSSAGRTAACGGVCLTG